MKLALRIFAVLCAGVMAGQAADSKIAAGAVNSLGVDLYRASARGESNLLLSPYSIQNALAMTYAGAAGDTRAEMQRVLHFPEDDNALHESFAALARDLAAMAAKTSERAKQNGERNSDGSTDPIEMRLANCLFPQRGFAFRAPFLTLLKEQYGAPLLGVDYEKDPDGARGAINRWVEQQTRHRIRDLIPTGAFPPRTKLTLVNVLYLRAPWETGFKEKLTKPQGFLVRGRESVAVPMMANEIGCGYRKENDFQIVSCPFSGSLQFLILLPDNPLGLPGLEAQLTPEVLAGCASLPRERIILRLPRLRIEPPTLPLGESLKMLGMKTAFDEPTGSANFDRMAAREPQKYLKIDSVFHKAVLFVDEKGSEAAAAAVAIAPLSLGAPPPPRIEVRVNHPFLFAIQDVTSGACLFLGRVSDPVVRFSP